ncbi:hypothetical protein J6590_048402 [Homalodisca vitripennis]|nr:hypothetical protein J6590_048402 [Homalodisca vitripennis]
MSTPPRPSRRSVAVIHLFFHSIPLPVWLYQHAAPHSNSKLKDRLAADDSKENRQDARSEDRPRKLSGRFSFRMRELDWRTSGGSFFPEVSFQVEESVKISLRLSGRLSCWSSQRWMWRTPLLTQEFKEGALSKPFRNLSEVETSCCLLSWALQESPGGWNFARVDDCCGVFSPSSLELSFNWVDKLLLVYLLNLLLTPL